MAQETTEKLTKAYKFAKANIPSVKQIADSIDRFEVDPNAQIPEFSSGARSYIFVAGNPIAVCLSFSWAVSASVEEIRTVDTHLPWDLAVGQVSIHAQLEQLIDPRNSAEAQGLFHTMQSIIHQPFVELQVQDRFGSEIFYAKGMFTGITGKVTQGQMSVRSASFTGVAYAHNVKQGFTPYDKGSSLDSGLSSVKSFVKKLSGFGL